jgi:hypothetical protein
MSTVEQAMEVVRLLEQVAEQVKDNPQGRSYLSRDGQGFALAVGGEAARGTQDFLAAVGRYLRRVQHGGGKIEAARTELLAALDQWLSTLKL